MQIALQKIDWYLNVLLFVEFDVMRKRKLENLIPGTTFTNISLKNMQGSKNYDNIWIGESTKSRHFTGQAGMWIRKQQHVTLLSVSQFLSDLELHITARSPKVWPLLINSHSFVQI